MQQRGGGWFGVLEWSVVFLVGVFVVTIVLVLTLIPRLDAGQKVLNAAKPAFQTQSLNGDVAGINIISADVDMANPIVNPQGGAAAEVPKLVAFVSQKTGLPQAKVLAALQTRFPHVTALLETLPLSSVTAELPGLLAFLEQTLHVSQPQLLTALKTNFPALTQAITNLPAVTGGWDNIPGMDGATRFDGSPIRTVPELRSYFKSDLIPMLASEQGNFKSLDGTASWTWISPLLLALGVVVVLFAGLMLVVNYTKRSTRRISTLGASVVLLAGIFVVVLCLGLSIVSRTGNGQTLLDALRPAMAASSVQGDRAGITMVSSIVNMEDPLMTSQGGAAEEVPKLVAFVSQKTGLPQAKVLAALQTHFPHVTALLEALPLSSVTAELPGLLSFLGGALHATEPQLLGALKTNFPALTQAITNLPAVTAGWENVPGMAGATRFGGTPIKTVPDVRSSFSDDVIPVLETERANYDTLMTTSRIAFVGPMVLVVGIIVVVYGLLMLFVARRLRFTGGAGAFA
jgi:hypothetical protein